MAKKEFRKHLIATACSLAIASMGGVAFAQTSGNSAVTTERAEITAESAHSAAQDVNEAIQVVRQMEQEQGMGQLLQNAEGIFIVPSYGRAALGIGVRGGEGVLMVKQNGEWSNPAFYDFGGVSAGVQAGAEGGNLAFVLNNKRAVESFMQENNWSLNADAGLTIVAWSARGQAAAGKGDVVVWSDTAGLMGDLAVSVTDINFDEEETASYYGRQVAVSDIVSGGVKNPHARQLKQALSGAAAATGGAAAAGAAGAEVDEKVGEEVGEEEGIVERGVVEQSVTEGGGIDQEGPVERGVESTGGMIEEGAETTGGAIEQGVESTGGAIEEGAEATGNTLERGAEATGNLIQEGAAETESAVEEGAAETGITEGGDTGPQRY